MEKVFEFIKNNKANIIIAFIYLTVAVITMLYHELWRDEAQAWCIARDCGFLEIFERSRIDGHPILWYWILMPFAKLGFDVISMQIIGLLFGFIAILYMLFKSPFNNFTKFIISFSAGLLYFLPIVVRNYSLIPIFVFLLAGIYDKKHEKPWLYSILIILLSNTHLLIEGFCAILFGLFAIESIEKSIKEKSYKNLYPLIPVVLNFLILFFWFKGVSADNHAISYYSQDFRANYSFSKALYLFSQTFFIFPFTIFAHTIRPVNPVIFYSSLSIFMISLFIKDKKSFLIIFSSFIFQFYVFYCVWFNGIKYQKTFIFLVAMIFCYWISYKKRDKFLTAAFCTLFVINSIFSIFSVMFEISNNFSASKQTVQFIKDNLKDEKVFYIEVKPFVFTAISAYLPKVKLYHEVLEKYVTYHDFKIDSKKEPMPELRYLITDTQHEEEPSKELFTKIFQSDKETISGSCTTHTEVFSIYKRNDI